jgi:hypothetical protein
MTRPIKRMPTPGGLGAGQTASVNLPIGLTYNTLMLNATIAGVDVAVADWTNQIDEIRLMVNGDARITISAADLVVMNQYYGQELVAGVLPLFLSRPWMRTITGEDQTGYGTGAYVNGAWMGRLDTFSLEFDLKAASTIDKVQIFAKQSVATPFGPHLRIQRLQINQGVTGEAQIADIPRSVYAAMAFHIGTSDIAEAEVVTDQRKIYETNTAIRAADAAVSKRVPQAGFTHLDMMAENRLAEALAMNVQDFRLVLEFEATGNFPLYIESVQGANSV